MGLGKIYKAEVKRRKYAIARLFPNDYFSYRELSCPDQCKAVTYLFEQDAMNCANRYGRDEECDYRRERFLLCEAIKREVETKKNPLAAAFENLKSLMVIAIAKAQVEKCKIDVIAKAEAEGEL